MDLIETEDEVDEYPKWRRLYLLRPIEKGSTEHHLQEEQWVQLSPPHFGEDGKMTSNMKMLSSEWTGLTYRLTRTLSMKELRGDPLNELVGNETLAFFQQSLDFIDFFAQVEGPPFKNEVCITGVRRLEP